MPVFQTRQLTGLDLTLYATIVLSPGGDTAGDCLNRKCETLPPKVLFLFLLLCTFHLRDRSFPSKYLHTVTFLWKRISNVWLCWIQSQRKSANFTFCCYSSTPCFNDATLTFCLFESINEFFVFWRLCSCKSQPARTRSFLFFPSFLTLLEPPSPFQINIQKHLIKNPTPHPPPEQDKQIRGCVCSLLAHLIHCFNDLASTSVEKKKGEMARCSGRI